MNEHLGRSRLRLRAARTKHGGRSRATEEALQQMRTLRRTARQMLANS